tara:strand:- start:549 stop:689 length:141 start_codon:yes stop_codon:yes gene_type:complete
MLAFYAHDFNSQHSGASQRFAHHGQRHYLLGCCSGKTGEELKTEGK